MHKSTIVQLVQLLEEEGHAVRTGNISALEPILEQKSELLITLESSPNNYTDIAIIRAKAARNEALLAAAIRGVKTARNRLLELESVKSELRVYGKDGSLQQTKGHSSALERKA